MKKVKKLMIIVLGLIILVCSSFNSHAAVKESTSKDGKYYVTTVAETFTKNELKELRAKGSVLKAHSYVKYARFKGDEYVAIKYTFPKLSKKVKVAVMVVEDAKINKDGYSNIWRWECNGEKSIKPNVEKTYSASKGISFKIVLTKAKE